MRWAQWPSAFRFASHRNHLRNAGDKTHIEIFTTISTYAKSATGAALGVSIAYALKAPTLVLFSAATVGIAGNELGILSAPWLPPSLPRNSEN